MFRDRTVSQGMRVIGRLKPDVTLAQARADLETLGRKLATDYPEADGGTTLDAVPLRADILGNLQPVLLVLLGAVGFVLLIACTNVANLLLVRSTRRAHEFSLRAALGASRGRLIRQLLTECVLLSFLAGAVALLLAHWGTRSALKALPITLPDVIRVDIDLRVLAFALGACVLTSLIFGLTPALSAARLNRQETLKEGCRSIAGGHSLMQGTLTVTELALAVVLLTGAGLMVRSLARILSVDPGFDSRNLMTFAVALPPSDKPNLETMREQDRQLVERLSAINGIESASLSFGALPMDGEGILPFWLEGEPVSAPRDARSALWFPVSPGYMRTLHIPLLRGRQLAPSDTHESPRVVVIDENFARSAFPNQDPIGKRINIGFVGFAQIVGVVGHVKQMGLDEDPQATVQAQFYMPFEQLPDQVAIGGTNAAVVVMRTSVPPESLLNAIRHEIKAIDNRQAIFHVRMIKDIITGTQAQRRFSMFLLSGFASIALLLAAVGIYGVISYGISQRTHEIGIRMALGAQKGNVLKMVIGNGMKLALIGVAIGIIGSLVLTRLLSDLLFGVSPTDPATFGVVSMVLLVVALLACYIPARRATRVDPAVALRHE